LREKFGICPCSENTGAGRGQFARDDKFPSHIIFRRSIVLAHLFFSERFNKRDAHLTIRLNINAWRQLWQAEFFWFAQGRRGWPVMRGGWVLFAPG
jgi:hypothetical protein